MHLQLTNVARMLFHLGKNISTKEHIRVPIRLFILTFHCGAQSVYIVLLLNMICKENSC